MTGEVEIAFIVAETVLEKRRFRCLTSSIRRSDFDGQCHDHGGTSKHFSVWARLSRPRVAGKINEGGLPANAIVFMGLVTLRFCGRRHSSKSCCRRPSNGGKYVFTVVAVLLLKATHEWSREVIFSMPCYPLPALIFLAITGWTVLYTATQYYGQLLVTAAIIAVGYPFFQRICSGAVNGVTVYLPKTSHNVVTLRGIFLKAANRFWGPLFYNRPMP